MAETGSHPSPTTTETQHNVESEFEHDGRLKIVITGLDQNVREQAIEAANAALNAKLAEAGNRNFKDFLKHTFTFRPGETLKDLKAMGHRVRYGNIGREYYLTKYQKQAAEEIIQSGNLLVHDNETDEALRLDTTMRFAHEYDEMIHRDAGERRTKLDFETRADGTRDEEGIRLKDELHKLIKDAASGAFDDASGNFDEDAFNEEKKRVISSAVQSGLTKDHVGPSMLYADNLLQIATHVRGAVESRRIAGETVDVDAMLNNTDIVLGEAKTGARSEIVASRVEKIARKLTHIPWVNEGTALTAASVLVSAGGFAVKRGIGRLVSSIAVPGLVGGVWAGLREKHRLEEERVQHSREMAEGKLDRAELEGRRAELDKTIYETRSATELKDQIGILYDENGELRIDSSQRLSEALFMIAEAQARIRLSDQKKIDLISFSEVGQVEKERFELDLALAKGKADIRKLLQNATDDELRALGLGDETIANMRNPDNDELDFLMEPQIEGVQGVLDTTLARLENGDETRGEQGTAARDRLFRKLRRKEVSKAFLKGTIFGVVAGLFAHEVAATVVSGAQGAATAAFESGNGGGSIDTALYDSPNATVETPLHYALNGGGGEGGTIEGTEAHVISPETKVNLPPGFETHVDPKTGEMSVTGHGVNVEHLKVTKDGSLTDESLQQLKAAGFKVDSIDSSQTAHEVAHHVKGMDAKEVIANHKGDTVHVKRDYWYDNDTNNIFDKNEQGLWNPVKQADGDIKITIGGMTENGSSHNGVYAHWHELAKDGDLKVALSLSKGTQSDVFMFNIDQHGNAIIPHDSPLASMFSKHDGHWRFDGKYTEVVQIHGVDTHGVTHMSPLATDVGRGHSTFTDTVIAKEMSKSTTYTIGFAENKPGDVLVPPVIPVYGRRGLEPIPERRRPTLPETLPSQFYYGMDGETLQTWLDRNRQRLSTRHRIKDGDTYRWVEADGTTEVTRDVDRERETLNKYIESIRVNEPEYAAYLEGLLNEATVQPMDSATRVAINIPAWMEEKNIYKLLEMYTNQTHKDGSPVAPESYEINIIVNRKTGATPDGTVAEIQRFLAESGALARGFKINFVDVEFDPPYNNVGHARRVLTDLTLMRSLARTSQDGPLYIESEDADILRLDPHTVSNLISKFDDNPHFDALRGVQDRAPEIMQGNDYLFLQQRLGNFSEVFLRDQRFRPENNPNWNPVFNTIATGGWNTAYTAEAYALIGGYDDLPPEGMGEDLAIGQKISMIRGDGTTANTHTIGQVYSRTDSSPRRFISEIYTGQGAYSSAFTDESLNKFIREATLDELMDSISDYSRINGQNSAQFKNLIQGHFEYFIRPLTPDLTSAQEVFGRTATFLGLQRSDYSFSADGQHVIIHNLSNVAAALEAYRTRRSGAPTQPQPPQPQPPQPQPTQPQPTTSPSPSPQPNPDTEVTPISADRAEDSLQRIENAESRGWTSTIDANFRVEGSNTQISGRYRYNGINAAGEHDFEPINDDGSVRPTSMAFGMERAELVRLMQEGLIKMAPAMRSTRRAPTTPPPTAPPTTTPPPRTPRPSPEQRALDRLNTLRIGELVPGLLTIGTTNYSGDWRYDGATADGETYTFTPVDRAGNPRTDLDILSLPRDEAVQYVRRGNLLI